MSQTLTITIDGKECTCEKGEYIYDVARRNGIPIPVLCRSDAFADHRACCRVCIVEVEEKGRRKVVTSCVYPIEQECAIFTQSEKILEERAIVIGLLAHRAPEAKRIAEMNSFMGTEGLDRLVTIDDEKCILCGLCVQACDGLGTGAISTVLRGTDKKVSTPYDKPSAFCVGCLSCANVCPTSAIDYTETDTTRTIWDREFQLVFCTECGALLGTAESVRHAVGADSDADADVPTVCEACRKKKMADEMMHTYRNV